MRRFLLAFGIFIVLSLSFVGLAVHAEVGPCPVFPDNNVWNRDVSADPVHPQSAAIIANINSHGGDFIHPDYGREEEEIPGEPPTYIITAQYGIPWMTVTNAQPNTNVTISDETGWPEESYNGPYPIPYDAPIEGIPGDGDNHVIVINTDTCILYELYHGNLLSGPQRWEADSGARFDLNIDDHWTDTWTSADAAGLPIFAGLVRCDEASTGEINHAFRFTVNKVRTAPGDNSAYVFPARHEAGNHTEAMSPPFGARFRLKADYPESGFHGQSLAVVKALKRYGMILADIGSNWYITGDNPTMYDPRCWDLDQLGELKDIPGTAFEVLAYPGTSASTPSAPHFSTTTPTLSWSPITWAVSYEIQVDDLTTFASPTTYTSPSANVTLSPAVAEDTYYWRVRAKAANNTFGAWSTAGSFVVALIP